MLGNFLLVTTGDLKMVWTLNFGCESELSIL